MGLSCLAEFGRFIEIGKRDIYQNSRIPLRPLRNNASFHVVAMDAVFHGDEALTRTDAGGNLRAGRKGALRPLPFRAFPASRIDSAFRLMASGKHIGKVVVRFPTPFVPRRGELPAPGFEMKPDGCYLITGAFGGYGKVLARWLVDCGARHLVLTSRSGAIESGGGGIRCRTCRSAAWTCASCRPMSAAPNDVQETLRRDQVRAVNRCAVCFISRW